MFAGGGEVRVGRGEGGEEVVGGRGGGGGGMRDNGGWE